MTIGETLAAEVQQEASISRRVLERVPTDNLEWQPHPKSMTMGRLAIHVAEIPQWLGAILDLDEFVMTGQYAPPTADSTQAILQLFDSQVESGIKKLKSKSDEHMNAIWKMSSQGKVFLKRPRAAVVRDFILSHAIHHRGQLSVYLRLNDIPVPSIYGPSADEQS